MTRFSVTRPLRRNEDPFQAVPPIEIEADYCEIESGCAVFTTNGNAGGRDLVRALAAGCWGEVRGLKDGETSGLHRLKWAEEELRMLKEFVNDRYAPPGEEIELLDYGTKVGFVPVIHGRSG